jgi:signal transduction histidine kinase
LPDAARGRLTLKQELLEVDVSHGKSATSVRISTKACWAASLASAGTGLVVVLLGQSHNPLTVPLVILACALTAGLVVRVAVSSAAKPASHTAAVEVVERTRELEERIRGKDELLTNTVHELRNPLSTVLASLDMLQDGHAVTSEDQESFLTQASTAARHLTFLLNDLLDSAAFDAGKLSLRMRRCDLREITTDAERLMNPLARARGVKLVIEHPMEDLAVIGDQGRILQVIFNLVSNALKYSPDRGVVVVRAITTDAGAVFEVEDEGAGVPTAARDSLFTRFGRIESPETLGTRGTGIGLYVSQMLVELMNGSIGFRERNNDSGSIFWFSLPMAALAGHHPGQSIDRESV